MARQEHSRSTGELLLVKPASVVGGRANSSNNSEMGKQKTIRKAIGPEPLIPKKLQHELGIYFARHSPKATNLALRNLLMDYLINGPDSDVRVENGLEIIWKLMRLLDKAQDMLPTRSINEVWTLSKKGDYYPELDEDDFDDGYDL